MHFNAANTLFSEWYCNTNFSHCPSASIKSYVMTWKQISPRSIAFPEKQTVSVLAIRKGVRFQVRQRKYLFIIGPTPTPVSAEPYIQCNCYVLQSRDQKAERHHNAADTLASKCGVSDIKRSIESNKECDTYNKRNTL